MTCCRCGLGSGRVLFAAAALVTLRGATPGLRCKCHLHFLNSNYPGMSNIFLSNCVSDCVNVRTAKGMKHQRAENHGTEGRPWPNLYCVGSALIRREYVTCILRSLGQGEKYNLYYFNYLPCNMNFTIMDKSIPK